MPAYIYRLADVFTVSFSRLNGLGFSTLYFGAPHTPHSSGLFMPVVSHGNLIFRK